MKANQTIRVLNYLQVFGSINPLQALGDLGVMRLAPRIADLKKMGYPIEKRMAEGRNRYGEKVHYAEYKLVKENESND